jgi:hypothetical protein
MKDSGTCERFGGNHSHKNPSTRCAGHSGRVSTERSSAMSREPRAFMGIRKNRQLEFTDIDANRNGGMAFTPIT